MAQRGTDTPLGRSVRRAALIIFGFATLAMPGACFVDPGLDPKPGEPSPVPADTLQSGAPGHVLGRVETAHGSPPIMLPGATVFLKDARG